MSERKGFVPALFFLRCAKGETGSSFFPSVVVIVAEADADFLRKAGVAAAAAGAAAEAGSLLLGPGGFATFFSVDPKGEGEASSSFSSRLGAIAELLFFSRASMFTVSSYAHTCLSD
jgi:hypothetical protein